MSAPDFSIGSTVWPGLAKVLEEASEVSQVIGKLLATGGQAAHWDGTDLQLRLEDELADLRAALDFAYAHNPGLDLDRMDARTDAKRQLFERWHCEQSQGADTSIDTATRQRIERAIQVIASEVFHQCRTHVDTSSLNDTGATIGETATRMEGFIAAYAVGTGQWESIDRGPESPVNFLDRVTTDRVARARGSVEDTLRLPHT